MAARERRRAAPRAGAGLRPHHVVRTGIGVRAGELCDLGCLVPAWRSGAPARASACVNAAVAGADQRLDQYTFGRGRFEESLTYSRERLQRVEAEFGPESEEVASDLINVGEALRVLGHTVEARGVFPKRWVEIRRKLGAPNELATSLNYLGLSAQTYSELVTIFEEALRIIDKVEDA